MKPLDNKNIKIFLELVLINLFILNLAMGTISNYSEKIFLLKALVSIFLIAVTVVNCRLLNEDWRAFIKDEGFKKTIVIILLLIAYLSITLTYSSNPDYGFQKILNFTISVVPSIIVFYFLISTLSETRIKLFIYTIVVIVTVSVSYIIIDYPFDQSTIYEYREGRWSHVIYGRMISSFAVVLLLYILSMIERGKTKEERLKVLFLMFITSIAIYGTYLSAFRAGFIGVLLVGIGLLLISTKIKVKGKKILTPDPRLLTYLKLFLPFILAAILIFTIPAKDIVTLRFDNMIAIENLNFKGDSAILSRIEYWNLSLEVFNKSPIIGVGFGGFSSHHRIESYPHNIILEIASELGIVGLIIFGWLLIIMFRSSYQYSLFTFLFLLFSFFLSLFSKELSNQGLLWIGVVFIGFMQNKGKEF